MRVLQKYYKGVTTVLQGCYITWVLLGCFKCVTRVFQIMLQECFKCVTRVLHRQGYYKGILTLSNLKTWRGLCKIGCLLTTRCQHFWECQRFYCWPFFCILVEKNSWVIFLKLDAWNSCIGWSQTPLFVFQWELWPPSPSQSRIKIAICPNWTKSKVTYFASSLVF